MMNKGVLSSILLVRFLLRLVRLILQRLERRSSQLASLMACHLVRSKAQVLVQARVIISWTGAISFSLINTPAQAQADPVTNSSNLQFRRFKSPSTSRSKTLFHFYHIFTQKEEREKSRRECLNIFLSIELSFVSYLILFDNVQCELWF